MNLRKAVVQYLEYVDENKIRRVHEVFPGWLRKHYKDIYKSTPAMKSLEKVLHKNDHRYRALPPDQKAKVKAKRKSLYDDIALSVHRPSLCLECGDTIYLNVSSKFPISLAEAINPREFCSVACSSTSSLVSARTIETNLRKYGTTCTLNTRANVRKKKATWKRKYGVSNPSHSPEVLGRILRSRYGHKTVSLNGKTFTYQGYEHVLLKYLVGRLRVPTNFITTSPVKVGMFSYVYLGKRLKYLPDIKARLPDGRLMYFEVKSTLTLNSSRSIRDRVYAKACAMWDQGKNYSLVLCSYNKILDKASSKSDLLKMFKRHQTW